MVSAICKSRLVALACALSSSAFAEHPIDVQRAAASGHYIQALADYARIPKRRITEDAATAAARSAWALGLPDRALLEFGRAAEMSGGDREKLASHSFSRAIIEYQEGRIQEAAVRALAAYQELKHPSPFRARVLLLLGQSLFQLGRVAQAETRIAQSLVESSEEDRSEIHFALGEARFGLSKFDQAKTNFEAVDLKSERIPFAIRYLARIALEQGKFREAKFWLMKGREEFRDSFLDSWVDYALLQAATHEGSEAEVREVVQKAAERYPPSDPWFTLLQAASEVYFRAGELRSAE
jgi:tetratricopeptide (TPR) repeat protein